MGRPIYSLMRLSMNLLRSGSEKSCRMTMTSSSPGFVLCQSSAKPAVSWFNDAYYAFISRFMYALTSIPSALYFFETASDPRSPPSSPAYQWNSRGVAGSKPASTRARRVAITFTDPEPSSSAPGERSLAGSSSSPRHETESI